MTEAEAYCRGWDACMAGVDGRYVTDAAPTAATRYAWTHGWLDAMEAEDGERPQPATAGHREG